MAKEKVAPSFESMMNFFLQHYNFATKKDINKVMDRIDELEKLIKNITLSAAKHAAAGFATPPPPASDTVLTAIMSAKEGATFAQIKSETGLNDKKIRNIIYRLGKLGKIKTRQRGRYVCV